MERLEQLMEEYKMLRSEIIYFMNKDTTLLTCLFSGVTAVLFFALKENITEVCLLTYLIIIPICSKLAYHQKQMAKIATYLSFFLEKELDIKWESRTREMSKQKDRPNNGKIFKFSECSMMACASLFSYGYLVIKNCLWKTCVITFCIESVLMVSLSVIVFIISKKIYKIKEYRYAYEEQMKKIEEKENKNDRANEKD